MREDANNTLISTKMQPKRIRIVLNVFSVNYDYVCALYIVQKLFRMTLVAFKVR